MKVYINKLNLTLLGEIQKLLVQNNKLIKTEQYLELITNEGIYHIDNSNVQRLIPKDGAITIFNNYHNEFTLIADFSIYEKQSVNSIHGDKHFQQSVTKYIYKTNSKLHFVIEIADNNTSKGKDCYFESNETIDINELFVKQAIIEFLSLLT